MTIARIDTLVKRLCATVTLCWAVMTAAAVETTPLLVDVPVPPDQITRLDERCNYIIDNYWKRLNFKGAFSSKDRMNATLGEFFALTPFATADTVHMAIDFLIKGIEKADGKNLLPLAQMAETWCMGDSALYPSEELMLPFAQAVASSKKVKGPEKDYYALMAQRLSNSRVGVAPADFEFIAPDGTTAHFSDVQEPTVLLFFYDPTDFDSRMARMRLGNNFVVKTLVNRGQLRVVAIYPGQPTPEWKADIDDLPELWVAGAAPDIDRYFTIKGYPQMYYMGQDRVISDKNFSIEAALMYFDQFLTPQN